MTQFVTINNALNAIDDEIATMFDAIKAGGDLNYWSVTDLAAHSKAVRTSLEVVMHSVRNSAQPSPYSH